MMNDTIINDKLALISILSRHVINFDFADFGNGTSIITISNHNKAKSKDVILSFAFNKYYDLSKITVTDKTKTLFSINL